MKAIIKTSFIRITCILLIVLTSAGTVRAYPPDNAAVLYYKAFLILKEPDEEVKKMLTALRKGEIESNVQIRQCLQENRHFFGLVETGARIHDCDWGHDISKGFDLLLPELSKIRFTTFMMIAKAQVLSEDGEYKAALETCIAVHGIARHVGDNFLISYLVGTSMSELANKQIKEILSQMPDDIETLVWLKNQLFDVSSNIPTMKGAMSSEKKVAIRQISKDNIESILEEIIHSEKDKGISAKLIETIRNADEEFFRSSRRYYTDLVIDAQAALDLPYPQSYRRFQELSDKIKKDASKNPAAILVASMSPAVAKFATIQANRRTSFNATRAAIDIYQVKAQTGRLPDKLPAGLPKDMFSGKDFEYEKTKIGFTLRCRGKNLDKDEFFQYEFKVAK